MKVVIDTNVLLGAVPKTSDSHLIFLSLLRGRFDMFVTTDILVEYEEILGRLANKTVAAQTFQVFDILPNLHRITRYYSWRLIVADPDDDKFVDCAVAANADFIVTDDRHYRVLKKVSFPKIRVIGSEAFLALLQQT